MKQVLVLAFLLTGFVAIAAPVPSKVNDKILKAFNETFASAQDVRWHEYDDYAQANFKVNLIQIRAQYSEDGKLIRTIRYYSENELLPNIVAKLKKKYAGKEITGVTESSSDDEVSFTINLKDEKHWYIVKTDVYGNLQESEKFKRADK
ncbi:hypothetical protein [Terrimonas pollutisoli]|uniref:hypothetical protein n=1 Tax=Terrimonas pollutisoli TaxID=3034147 RepID=UPI0023EC6199|nr:hypothetical protein [Terrimonas sp. H1YJ31]